MQEVKIVDIDNVQWNIKDQEARNKITTLEEKATKNFEYSTTEQEIGKWVDGRKHYRLTVVGNTTTRSAQISLEDKNIKDITKINGVCNASDRYFFPLPYYFLDRVESVMDYFTYLYYDISSQRMNLSFGKDSYFDNVTFSIEIEYTKNS